MGACRCSWANGRAAGHPRLLLPSRLPRVPSLLRKSACKGSAAWCVVSLAHFIVWISSAHCAAGGRLAAPQVGTASHAPPLPRPSNWAAYQVLCLPQVVARGHLPPLPRHTRGGKQIDVVQMLQAAQQDVRRQMHGVCGRLGDPAGCKAGAWRHAPWRARTGVAASAPRYHGEELEDCAGGQCSEQVAGAFQRLMGWLGALRHAAAQRRRGASFTQR